MPTPVGSKYSEVSWADKAHMHYTDSFNMAQQALGLMNSIVGPSAVTPQIALQQSIVVSQLSAAHAGLANYCLERSRYGADAMAPTVEGGQGEQAAPTQPSVLRGRGSKVSGPHQRDTEEQASTPEPIRQLHPAYEVPDSQEDTEQS